MSYLVLARKWRPKSLADLLGQEHVAVTLTNAIASDRVAHAFLFTGVRGVGKTSAARILSMALNCERADAPTATPCGECDTCARIMTSSHVDVQEIDGASNNSVDDVRGLRETVAYRPARSRYKVYIIDEVHMLSQSAFNALLKTLEEPPPHVKFIFATTEPHRIPVTILSRCQRYDFRRIAAGAIEGKLRAICAAEGIAVDEGAVTLIAREAGGSMRDALSLLDQVIAAFGSGITRAQALYLLGVAGSEVNTKLTRRLLARDTRGCLEVIEELHRDGHDFLRFMEQYLAHVRDLIVVRAAGKDAPGLALAAWEAEELAAIAGEVELPDLYRVFSTVARTLQIAPYTASPKILFETTVIKLSRDEPLASVEKILTRLGELKRGGALPSVPPAAPAARGGETAGGGGTGGPPREEPSARREPERAREPAAPGPRAATLALVPAPADMSGATAPAAAAPTGRLDEETWRAVVDEVLRERPLLGGALREGLFVRADGRRVVIGYPSEDFNCELARKEENMAFARAALRRVAGRDAELVVEGNSAEAGERRRAEQERFRDQRARAEQEARAHPAVAETLMIFGGSIVDIKTDVE